MAMRIVFLGTPDFAVATLKALHEAGHTIAGVVTAPDRPAGRGMQPRMSAVKHYALQHELPLAQPEKLRDPAFLDWLKSCRAEVQVVVAFRMLPEVVWNMPPLGTLNVHASLLPQYRGAAPINWAIIQGENTTGVTIFRLQQAIDTGPILARKSLLIAPEDNAGTIHDALMQLGAATMLEVLEGLEAGTIEAIPQEQLGPAEPVQPAPKIFTETCRINWQQPATTCLNLVRGLSPYPGAFTEIDGKILKVFAATIRPFDQPAPIPGTLDSDGKNYLRIAAADGWLSLLQVQLQGKKQLDIVSFLRGYRLPPAGH